ncbi:hypothetical protein SS05631_c08450 [Sinorhizobium sp. CCBAU 05631]|nr:hypothetical protein SS05631_c08450 [Sinorhizobium sp. CCBAU 05631]
MTNRRASEFAADAETDRTALAASTSRGVTHRLSSGAQISVS